MKAFIAALRGVSNRTRAEMLLGALFVATLLFQRHDLNTLRSSVGRLALAADTLIAHADTTRRLTIAMAAGQQAVQRQAIQATQRADSLDRQLKLERISKTQLVARVETLTVRGSAAVTVANASDTATRSAVFQGRDAPYTYRDSVALPAPPHTATHALSVSLDSLALEVRLGCGQVNADGMRSAFATVTGPTWAHLNLSRVEQSPDLCRSPALEPVNGDGRAWWRKFVDRFGVSAGYGAAVSSDGRVSVGPALVAGFKLWP